MAFKSLILGMMFSIGIFAAKSGLGMAFGTLENRFRVKVIGVSAFSITYGLVFLAAGLFLVFFDILSHLNDFQAFIQSGMVVHGVMAVLMSVWGLALLRTQSSHKHKSRGWLLLVVPCPVCAASILFSAAFFLSLFPDRPVMTLAGLYGVFVMISLAAMIPAQIVLSRQNDGKGRTPQAFLGGVMLLIAAYFMVSVTVMPHVGNLESIYRLALYTSTATAPDMQSTIGTALLMALAFGWGWFLHIKHTITYDEKNTFPIQK